MQGMNLEERALSIWAIHLVIFKLFSFGERFYTFSAGFYSFPARQTNPLQVGIFSFFTGWVILTSKLFFGK